MSTYTYATLEVPKPIWTAIANRLHAVESFDPRRGLCDELDMHGIALVPEEGPQYVELKIAQRKTAWRLAFMALCLLVRGTIWAHLEVDG